MISTDFSLGTFSLMYWNVEDFGPFWMWQRNRDLSFTSMKNITIFCSQLQVKMHNFPNYKFKSRACQNTLKSSKRNWYFQVNSSGNVRLKNKCLVRSITTNGYLSSFDRIMSWVWFDVVWAEKFMKLAMYLKQKAEKSTSVRLLTGTNLGHN